MVIYFDNSATTNVRPEVVQAMMLYLAESFGNPSSIHSVGRGAHKAVAQARKQVADLLSCSPAEVMFSACGTMSNNLAILGRARFAEANSLGRHLITTQIEHPSVLGPCKHLESLGWRVTYLPVDQEGFVRLDKLQSALSDDTSIVSIMWANNEIGTIQPMEEIASIIEAKRAAIGKHIFFHSDAVQASGKVPLDTSKVSVSALSISGHKFHAPKGVGALFLRQGQNVMPITFGGGQEKGLLPGTEGLANIVALGKAAELANEDMENATKRLSEMQQYLLERLEKIPGISLTGAKDLAKRLPGHISLSVENAEGEGLVMQLDMKGVCVSSASACHTGVIEPSHVLGALNLPCSLLKGSVRISLSSFNTLEECETAIKHMERIFVSQKTAASS